jgi:tetrahydromethanopterin S-methyltransferase subunit G
MDEQLPSKQVLDARFSELERQRNDALERNVFLVGEIAQLTGQVAELQAQLLKQEQGE